MLAGFLLAECPCARALNPSLDLNQYAHTAWTGRQGLKGITRAIVQTPDGYVWLGTEFGLVRFDGARFVPWSPPTGQHLPSNNIRSLAAARDGTLWIGTFEGLASWNHGRLNQYAELSGQNVLTLREDRQGTVWAGTFGTAGGKLCSIQRSGVECYGGDGSLGQWVYSVYEHNGQLWVHTGAGLWRWKPGPPKRYFVRLPGSYESSQTLAQSDDGAGLIASAMSSALMRV
jgi:ligand-binding sensor domain-containing protein